MKAKAAPWKHGTISKLGEDIAKGGTLAIIDIHGIPAGAFSWRSPRSSTVVLQLRFPV